MKNIKSRIAAIALALVMVFGFTGCSSTFDDMMDFIRNGWDGIFDAKVRAEYIAPDPSVRTHDIREDHKVVTVNNVIREDHKVAGVKHEVGTATPDTSVAKTDTVD